MRITRKLGLLVGVPLVAVVAFAALAVNTSGGQALRAENLRHLVATGARAGELAHRLQAERAGAVNVLASGASAAADGFQQRVATAQRATDDYRQARAELADLPAATRTRLDRIDQQVARLDALRDQIAAGRGAVSAVAFTYRIVIADLIAFRESVAQAGGAPAELADRLRAAAALSQAAEQVGRQQVAVLRAVELGPVTPAAVQEITAARTGHLEALSTFDGLATPPWRAALERSAVGEEMLAARRLEDRVGRTSAGERLDVDPERWTAALDFRMQRLRDVEAGIDSDILAEVTALRDAQRLTTGGQIAAVLLAVAAAVGLAAILGRPVVRGLRRLREAAHEVAVRGLPAAVARLEHQEALGGLTPEQVAEQAPAPVRVRGRDELAEVGEAFNAVHRAAVRTAAEQAQLRLSIAAIMLNLARRGQKLTGRLTAALDDVERDELDPNRLAQLYQLDLMATLLGGTNESLLVLGGAASAQVRTVDEPLADVLRGALGQVEQYTRIEPGVVDDGVAVRAGVVDEVVKLLAELLDNACRYSPPQAPVRVDARWLADRVIIQIADEGIGINPARRNELNRRLAVRPVLDLAAVEAMGLTVVAYLAARHRIRVELRDGHRRGTIAEVTLPPELVAVGIEHRVPARVPRPRAPVRSAPPASPAAPLFQRPDLPWPPAPDRPDQLPPVPAGTLPPAPARPQLAAPVSTLADQSVPAAPDRPVPVGAGSAAARRAGSPTPRPRPAARVPGDPGALDQTAELRLPIFEQVQRSRWFTSANELAALTDASSGAGTGGAGTGVIEVGTGIGPGTGTGTGGGTGTGFGTGTGTGADADADGDVAGRSGAAPSAESGSWQTPADVGWQAAARAAAPQPAGTTHSGLPVRRPGAQLVPGGVADPDGAAAPPPPADWRDPVQVSAVAAAYSRGLSTGRAQQATSVAGWRSANEASGQAAGPGTLVRPHPPAPHGNGAPAS